MKTKPQINKQGVFLILGVIFLNSIGAGFQSNQTAFAQAVGQSLTPGGPKGVYLPLVRGTKAGTRPTTPSGPVGASSSRGYMTTPAELVAIQQKADQKIEPYRSAVSAVMKLANAAWDFPLESTVTCPDSDSPAWLDNGGGVPVLYAKALAYHLTGNQQYAAEVKTILERIMSEVENISLEQACRLRFAWGSPELVASADLIEDYWQGMTCQGPSGTLNSDNKLETGDCKDLFQNWLVKNPYYIVSYSATSSQSNWGAAATNTTLYIADYLWDRPEVVLIHRNPKQIDGGKTFEQSPAQAFAFSRQIMLDRMNGYRVEYGSSDSCDYLSGPQQNSQWTPVKSQISEKGIIPEDTRREQSCNAPAYDGAYHNYPQLHLGHNIQQCELLLRRGDSSCFDNVDQTDLPNYTFVDPKGATQTTHLYPGRGSVERVIQAVIIDSHTEWKHDSALAVAYRYYFNQHTLPGFEQWRAEIDAWGDCGQDSCFGGLTHGFAPGETPGLPPFVPAP